MKTDVAPVTIFFDIGPYVSGPHRNPVLVEVDGADELPAHEACRALGDGVVNLSRRHEPVIDLWKAELRRSCEVGQPGPVGAKNLSTRKLSERRRPLALCIGLFDATQLTPEVGFVSAEGQEGRLALIAAGVIVLFVAVVALFDAQLEDAVAAVGRDGEVGGAAGGVGLARLSAASGAADIRIGGVRRGVAGVRGRRDLAGAAAVGRAAGASGCHERFGVTTAGVVSPRGASTQ